MIKWLKMIDYDYSMEFVVFSASFILVLYAILIIIQAYRKQKRFMSLYGIKKMNKKSILKNILKIF